MTTLVDSAQTFLAGEKLTFEQANALWKNLKKADELSLARRVLRRLRAGNGLIDQLPTDRRARNVLCQQEALLTSKDPELGAAVRHDRALQILESEFDLDDPALDGDAETLGIAGGILKRRWGELGGLEDLRRAGRLYQRAAGQDLGDDAYTHVNAAFVDDLLAYVGDEPAVRRERARMLRQRIVDDLRPAEAVSAGGAWFNAASRAEALFGLGRYAEATQAVANATNRPTLWELETTARQLATIAHLQHRNPLAKPEIRRFFEALLPGAADAARSAFVGKVGIALSGGGFRAAFYHLGLLARLAELDVLRHVDVLSGVSGGSIVGACYWLGLRNRLLKPAPMTRDDYVELVQEIIQRLLEAVSTDLRGAIKPSMPAAAWRLLKGEKGAADSADMAAALEEHFYRPLFPGEGRLFMHQLPFTPADHDPRLTGSSDFHPGKHNWLRAHKVPALVINATTMNTGHAWQFTPTWMGESPWAVHAAAESIPRLKWSWYEPARDWAMELGRAVAASGSVPGIIAPVEIANAYTDIHVQLVDGGLHDNEGTVSLLALNCNVVIVSDACGQLLFEKRPRAGIRGLAANAMRSMEMLMERVRLATFESLAARQRTGLLRGLMFLHMKAGLEADPIPLRFSQEFDESSGETLSASGIRRDFQRALAELRSDIDAFTPDESHALMAFGYRMATWAFARDLAQLDELWDEPVEAAWPFAAMLEEITSTAPATPRRSQLLAALQAGSTVRQ